MRRTIAVQWLDTYTTACGDNDRGCIPTAVVDIFNWNGIKEVTVECFYSGAVFNIESLTSPRISDTDAKAITMACKAAGCSLRAEQCKINGENVTFFESE